MPSTIVEAPIGGWNARESLDNMAITDAVELINWIPDSGWLRGRKGCSDFVSSGMGTDDVETLAVYKAEGTSKFLAGTNGNIYDITSGTPSDLAGAFGAFTNDRWQTVHFQDKLILLNGADAPKQFDGTTLTDLTVSSGPTATDLVGGIVWRGRAIYWENASQSIWYATAGAYQGALSEYDLGGFVNKGGNLLFAAPWTRDSGEGMDDFICFYFDTGEVLIYQGSDPGSTADWAKVGLFDIGRPISVRGHAKLAADQVIASYDGYLNFTAALTASTATDRPFIGGKIVNAAKERARKFGDNFGWEVTYFPGGNLLIVNVPIITNSLYEQHVLNTNTGAWTKFEGLNARTWAVYDGELYFGAGSGKVMKYDGYQDDGEAITYHALPAFNYLGDPTRKKQLTGFGLITNLQNPNYIGIKGAADFQIPDRGVAGVIPDTASTAWGAVWGSPWGGGSDNRPTRAMLPTTAYGTALSVQTRFALEYREPRWFSSQYIFGFGGPV